MSLGAKLQAVHSKVNTKLGTQDASMTFRKKTTVRNTELGRPHTSVTNSDVVIAAGIKVERVKAYETDAGGTIQIGDLKLTIPGGLITEAQLTGAEIIYSGQTYSIKAMHPTEILSGVAVNWRVIAGLEK
jgi:hypothetical protein